jgi:hypothetical protein
MGEEVFNFVTVPRDDFSANFAQNTS